jgi:hypothetical protein
MVNKEKTVASGSPNRYFNAMRAVGQENLTFRLQLLMAACLISIGAWAGAPERVPLSKEKIKGIEYYRPTEGPRESPAGQARKDLELFWSAIQQDPQRFWAVGDLPTLYSFNQRAAEIFEELLDCNQGNFAKLRQDYAQGKFCSGLSAGDELREKYQRLKDETRGWLATAEFSSPRDKKWGELGLLNPLKKHSIDVYAAGQGFNVYIKYHFLWIQAVLEIAASTALYSGLDEDQYKQIKKVYDQSQDVNYRVWVRELTGHLKASLESVNLPALSDYQNEAFARMYASDRSLHMTLKLFSYLSPRDCSERGLFPEVASVITEGWEPLIYLFFDPEFGESLRSDQTTNSVWMELSCGTPAFLRGGDRATWFAKRKLRNDFHSVVRFYRRLDKTFSEESK